VGAGVVLVLLVVALAARSSGGSDGEGVSAANEPAASESLPTRTIGTVVSLDQFPDASMRLRSRARFVVRRGTRDVRCGASVFAAGSERALALICGAGLPERTGLWLRDGGRDRFLGSPLQGASGRLTTNVPLGAVRASAHVLLTREVPGPEDAPLPKRPGPVLGRIAVG
jgi:hypothetical protein